MLKTDISSASFVRNGMSETSQERLRQTWMLFINDYCVFTVGLLISGAKGGQVRVINVKISNIT